ncbi:hypothetical protein [Anoxynatronum sibiricum]|uniref:Uncharacterized protein n=1 Tax=Anoxynatronum sibiricum TaxID=210623 RepID=A0ABU9VTI0_9CLOT
MTEQWTEQKEKSILKRYRYTSVYRIITVGILLFLGYTMDVLALTVAYDHTSRGEADNACPVTG